MITTGHHVLQCCQIHKSILRQCRCPGATAITWLECPEDGSCFNTELRAALDDHGKVVRWREPKLPFDNEDSN